MGELKCNFGDPEVLRDPGSDSRSVARGGGASVLGHGSGIRNLDPPDPQQAVKYGDGWGRKTGLSPLKAHTKEEFFLGGGGKGGGL